MTVSNDDGPRATWAYSAPTAWAYEKVCNANNEKRERIVELEREIAAIKRGEFICKKCGLRKDSEHDQANF